MEPTEQEVEAQEAQDAAPEHAAPHAAPEPKRRGRPLGARTNLSRTCLLSRLLQSASQSRLHLRRRRHTRRHQAPPVEALQLTREQQRALRMLERQSAYDRLTTGASVLV